VPLAVAWQVPEFRRLLAVFLLNGIAAAVPATLLLFFIDDRLRLPESQGLFLASYFVAAVVSLPAWLRVIARLGQPRAWGLGMALAVAAFAWAAALGSGDRMGFLAVCIASGAALGADLAIPGALLAGVVQRAGLAGRAEGAFFGWWNAATKLNLALAAGLALPLLQLLGYAPGQRDPQALQALAIAYCLLPCALKLAAAALLYRHFIATP
jgi:Na+/melibiose symporter-like transporter